MYMEQLRPYSATPLARATPARFAADLSVGARVRKFGLIAAPYALLLLAFVVRIYAPDSGWVYRDQTYLRGQGIIALNNLLTGNFAELPVFTYNSSSGLLNPGLMIYVWAFVAAIDSSQLFATIVNLMLNWLAVVMVYALAKTLMPKPAALFAMLLIAISPWATGVARGTWQPGQLEFCFALVAWLTLTGLTQQRPRWIIAGFTAAAICIWTYTLAFALVAQVGLACVIFFRRAIARPVFYGWLICGASMLLMALLALATGRQSTVADFAQWVGAPDAVNTLVEQAFDPLLHTLRIASGLDYAQTWISPTTPLWQIGQPFNQGLGLLIIALTGVGALFMIDAIRKRQPQARTWIALFVWLCLPAVTFALLKYLESGLLVQLYYLLLSVPAGYVIPALALHTLAGRLTSEAARQCVHCGYGGGCADRDAICGVAHNCCGG